MDSSCPIKKQNGVEQPGLPQPEKFQIVNGYLQVGKKRYQIHYYPQGKQVGIKTILNLNQNQEELFLNLLEAANVNRDKLAELAISAKGTIYKSNPTTYTPLPPAAHTIFKKLTFIASQAMKQPGRELAAAQDSVLLNAAVSPVEGESTVAPSNGEFIFEEVTVSPPVNKPTFREELFKLSFILNFAAGMQIREIKHEPGSKISDPTLKMLRTELEKSPQALIDFEKAYQDTAIKPLIIGFLNAHSAFEAKEDADLSLEELGKIMETRDALMQMIGLSSTREILNKISASATDSAWAQKFSRDISSLSGKSINSTILKKVVMDHPELTSKFSEFLELRKKIEANQREKQNWKDPDCIEGDDLRNVIINFTIPLNNVEGGKEVIDALMFILDCTVNPLKKDMLQLLGESSKEEIDKILTVLPKSINDPRGALLSSYAAMIGAAVSAKELNTKALQEGKEADLKSIERFEDYQKKVYKEVRKIAKKDPDSAEEFELIAYPFMLEIETKTSHDRYINDTLSNLASIGGPLLSSSAKDLIIQACRNLPGFSGQLEDFAKASKAAKEFDKETFPQWIENEHILFLTDKQTELNKVVEDLHRNLTNRLTHVNKAAILYLSNVKELALSNGILHKEVIRLVDDTSLKIGLSSAMPLSKETRLELIQYLTTVERCKAYERLLTSYGQDLPEEAVQLFIGHKDSLIMFGEYSKFLPDIAREQLACASHDREFLYNLRIFMEASKNAQESDKGAFQQWIDRKSNLFGTDQQKKLHEEVEVLLTDLRSRLSNTTSKNLESLNFLYKIKILALSPSILHEEIISLVDVTSRRFALSDAIRLKLIDYLESRQLCRSFKRFVAAPSTQPLTENDILFFLSLEKTNTIHELFSNNIGQISFIQLENFEQKINDGSAALILSDEQQKILDEIPNPADESNFLLRAKLPENAPQWMKDKLAVLLEIHRFKGFLHYLNSLENETVWKNIQNTINDPNKLTKIDGQANQLGEEIPKELQTDIRNIKILIAANSSNNIKNSEVTKFSLPAKEKKIYENFCKARAISDKFTLGKSVAYTDSYKSKALKLHSSFKTEYGPLDQSDIPTLNQLKCALTILKNNFPFLLSARLNDDERRSVEQLVMVIMTGNKDAAIPETVTSLTFKGAEELFEEYPMNLAGEKDFLHWILIHRATVANPEQAKELALKDFSLDHIGRTFNFSIGKDRKVAHIGADGRLLSFTREQIKNTFESLRDHYFDYLTKDSKRILTDIAANESNTDILLPTLSKEEFKKLLTRSMSELKPIEGSAEDYINNIVEATKFSQEQIEALSLQVKDQHINPQAIESMMRIKAIHLMFMMTQANAALLLSSDYAHKDKKHPFMDDISTKMELRIFPEWLEHSWNIDENFTPNCELTGVFRAITSDLDIRGNLGNLDINAGYGGPLVRFTQKAVYHKISSEKKEEESPVSVTHYKDIRFGVDSLPYLDQLIQIFTPIQ